MGSRGIWILIVKKRTQNEPNNHTKRWTQQQEMKKWAVKPTDISATVAMTFLITIDLKTILWVMRTTTTQDTITRAAVAVVVALSWTNEGGIEMVANGHPVCCIGKPCGDTCIAVDEDCHVGSGGASCSSNSNCACNQCDASNAECGCGNLAAGECTTESCATCCWDPGCSRHNWVL